MAQFEITATWVVEGVFTIEADNIEEAELEAEGLSPYNAEYDEVLDDSFEVVDTAEL
tara:strand:- start:243 stop:413 length:171 start_codon:yes stop_codon:yes gene_type:complete